MVRISVVVLTLLGVLARDYPAAAGPILDRVKAQGLVHCGSVERPGLASSDGGRYRGLAVDICRAVATAVLGSPAHIAFHDYETPKQYDAVAER